MRKKKTSKANNGKNKNKFLISLETKFGSILEKLKRDELKEMNMENANIDDSEIKILSSILMNGQNLKMLSLKRNNISDKGVSSLCNALSSTQIEILDLSYNSISVRSFDFFKKYKMKNDFIKTINLRNNDIPNSVKRKKNIEFQRMGLIFDF